MNELHAMANILTRDTERRPATVEADGPKPGTPGSPGARSAERTLPLEPGWGPWPPPPLRKPECGHYRTPHLPLMPHFFPYHGCFLASHLGRDPLLCTNPLDFSVHLSIHSPMKSFVW